MCDKITFVVPIDTLDVMLQVEGKKVIECFMTK